MKGLLDLCCQPTTCTGIGVVHSWLVVAICFACSDALYTGQSAPSSQICHIYM